MISSKTVATLFFITLSVQIAASTSPESTQESSSSNKSTLRVREQRSATKAKKTNLVSQDTAITGEDVEIQGENSEEMDIPQEQSALQIDKELGESIDQIEYEEIEKFIEDLANGEFLKHIRPIATTLTLKQYYKNHN